NNGRYAEAEEALAELESAARKDPKKLTPALKAAIALARAEGQSSQGEYAKAIGTLKAAEADEPKNADRQGQSADVVLHRGDRDGWEGRRGSAEAGREDRPRPPSGPMGRGPAAGPPRRDREGRRRLQVVRRPLQPPPGRDRPRRRGPAHRRPGRRAVLSGLRP